MVFNSQTFLLFFLTFYVIYWVLVKKNTTQNIALLIANYVFLAWWDWRFLVVLVISSAVNFQLGISIANAKNEKQQRSYRNLGIVYCLGTLLFFKYCNFFIESLNDVLSAFNVHSNIHTFNILLPLGISFYTFRSVSYLLDVENENTNACTNPLLFFSYLSFFPTVLSGPIDKARDFIPQLEKQREFNYSKTIDGLKQLLWGLFKKVVIADNCGVIVNPVFDNHGSMAGSTLFIVAFLYLVQIYADFSGYSDMAIGIARILGFNVTKNFNFPFFAQNIAEFWQKWHISLTSWMTEYVYTPLSFIFRSMGKGGTILAIIVNFVLIGFWHGANWTYIVYGLLHGLYFIPLILNGTLNLKKQIAENSTLPSVKEFLNVLATITLVSFTIILFRAENIDEAVSYYKNIFSSSFFSVPDFPVQNHKIIITLFFVSILFIIEWHGRKEEYGFATFGLKWPVLVRWGVYFSFIFIIAYYSGHDEQFIYFQF